MKKLALLAAAMMATTAVPAIAAPITYTISGVFTGTLNGNPFDVPATFVGRGDTTNTTTAFFGQGVGVPLSSFTALSGGVTYTITQPSYFYTYAAGAFGNPLPRVGFSFDTSGQNALGLESPVFAGYDGVSGFPLTPATVYFQNATFTTDQGPVTITGFTGGSFSAAVPEPATWAFMIAGFGLVGAAMRRRSTVRTSVTYA